MTDEAKNRLTTATGAALTFLFGLAVGKGYIPVGLADPLKEISAALLPIAVAWAVDKRRGKKTEEKTQARVAEAKDAPRETVLSPEKRAEIRADGGD